MQQLKPNHNLLDMASEYEYTIIMTSDNAFLGFDVVLHRYCIVYFKMKDGVYLLDNDNEPCCYATEQEAEHIFTGMLKRSA